MDEMDTLRQATKRLKRLDDDMTDARNDTYAAVIAALRAGHTPTEVTDASPYTAAYVRKIARQNGIEPATRGPKKTNGRPAKLAETPDVTHEAGTPEWVASKSAGIPPTPEES